MDAPLDQLANAAGVEFPNLKSARATTGLKLKARRALLKELAENDDWSVIFVGSIGRQEATSDSDDDFMLLVDGDMTLTLPEVHERFETLADYTPPSSRGVFGEPVPLTEMVENIGLAADSNTNTTRRMLFLLESEWVSGEPCYLRSFDAVLDRYLDDSVKNFRPPRFLLNDVVRYWRTMCVDFAGKEREGPGKWGIRNAKLRTSRKMLFAGGLLPIIECSSFETEEMEGFLRSEFGMPPTDRVAASFLRHDATDAGVRTFSAYDEFVAILSEPERRAELEALIRDEAPGSELFRQVRSLGDQIQSGLLALLFETRDLADTSREYLVF